MSSASLSVGGGSSTDAGQLFAVAVSISRQQAVVAVRGDVDLVSAPDLQAFLLAVIHRGHHQVVLDLAELHFLDGAAVGAITAGAELLSGLGGTLTISGAAPFVRRIFEVMGCSDLLADVESEAGRLGPEQRVTGAGLAGKASADGLRQLRRVTAIPADDEVVNGALRLVVALARETVGGADGVSVSLRRHGKLSTVAASDRTIADMDADQYATGEGPCVDAAAEGRWFHVEALRFETRWPAFTPRARSLGINAILSSPLHAGNQPVGALNIYSRTKGAFHPADQQLAAVFASEASRILTDAGTDRSDDELSQWLEEALRTRQIIAQAQGVIMARDGVSEDAAYTVLRRASQLTTRPLRDEAARVLDATPPGSTPPADTDTDRGGRA